MVSVIYTLYVKRKLPKKNPLVADGKFMLQIFSSIRRKSTAKIWEWPPFHFLPFYKYRYMNILSQKSVEWEISEYTINDWKDK